MSLVFGFALATPPNRSAEAREWFAKAVAAFQRGDMGGTKLALEEAFRAKPDLAEAFYLKGALLEREGRMEEARRSVERAFDLDPTLKDKAWEHLERRAHEIEDRLTSQDFSHFRLQFHGGERREDAWKAIAHLNDAYNYLGSRFGIFPEEKIPVIIFTTEEFVEAWRQPWLGGFFDPGDGKVRVCLEPPPGGDPEFRHILRHEFTHAFLNQLAGQSVPMWLQEGVAQFYAYADASDMFWKDKRLDEFRKKIEEGAPWMSFPDVKRAIEKKDVHPLRILWAYEHAEALVIYLARQRGESWIPSLVERLRRGVSFETAFRVVVGLTPAEALQQFRQSWQ